MQSEIKDQKLQTELERFEAYPVLPVSADIHISAQ